MISSYWCWPSYLHWTQDSPLLWEAYIRPGEVRVWWKWMGNPSDGASFAHWSIDLRYDKKYYAYPVNRPIVWLPSVDFKDLGGNDTEHVSSPLWMPFILAALPTGILFYRDRKPKPGCCAKCRYDLTGLSGHTCPECGAEIAITDSHEAPSSAAEGKNGAGLEGNGVS